MELVPVNLLPNFRDAKMNARSFCSTYISCLLLTVGLYKHKRLLEVKTR